MARGLGPTAVPACSGSGVCVLERQRCWVQLLAPAGYVLQRVRSRARELGQGLGHSALSSG